jgi:hypothetical protein
MVNPARPGAKWNAYDIMFEAPRFRMERWSMRHISRSSSMECWCRNHQEQLGTTIWRQVPKYTAHAAEEVLLSLRDHFRSRYATATSGFAVLQQAEARRPLTRHYTRG